MTFLVKVKNKKNGRYLIINDVPFLFRLIDLWLPNNMVFYSFPKQEWLSLQPACQITDLRLELRNPFARQSGQEGCSSAFFGTNEKKQRNSYSVGLTMPINSPITRKLSASDSSRRIGE